MKSRMKEVIRTPLQEKTQGNGLFHKDKTFGMRKRINSFEQAISNEELRALPLSSFSGEIIVVDDPATVPAAIKILKRYSLLGFDTETKPAFKKGVINEVALLQLAAEDRAFIFRLNKIGLPPSLASLMANPRIVKVGAAIRDDIRLLQRLARFLPEGFIELQDLVKEYHISDSGLRKMAAIVLGIQISKSQQVSNWEREVLTEAQLIYAATDAWVCHEIYRNLIAAG
jgi:ribonuclease D